MRTFSTLLCLTLIGANAPAHAQDQSYSDQWSYTLTPYLWLPSIGGDLNYSIPPGSPGTPSIKVGPTDWFELLDFAFLLNGTARKNRFSFQSDIVYLALGSDGNSRVTGVDTSITGPGGRLDIPVGAHVGLESRTDLDGLAWSLIFGYNLQQDARAQHDLIGGARYFGLDVKTHWNLNVDITTPGGDLALARSGTIEQDVTLWDGVIGLRGHVALGDGNWSLPYYVDVGAGDSDLTWQGMLGVSYEYGWGDLFLVYRHLYYDEGDSGLMSNFYFSGPTIGGRFSW